MGNGDLNNSGLVKFVEEFAKTELTQLNSPTAFESCASSHSDSFRKMAGKRKRLNSSCRFLAFIPHVYGYPRRVGRTPFIYFEKLSDFDQVAKFLVSIVAGIKLRSLLCDVLSNLP